MIDHGKYGWRRMTAREWLRWCWAKATINWLTVGLHCALRGHEWRTDSVGCRYCSHTSCAYCGQYKGCRSRETPVPRWRVVPPWQAHESEFDVPERPYEITLDEDERTDR